jgi:hypothetical protein
LVVKGGVVARVGAAVAAAVDAVDEAGVVDVLVDVVVVAAGFAVIGFMKVKIDDEAEDDDDEGSMDDEEGAVDDDDAGAADEADDDDDEIADEDAEASADATCDAALRVLYAVDIIASACWRVKFGDTTGLYSEGAPASEGVMCGPEGGVVAPG